MDPFSLFLGLTGAAGSLLKGFGASGQDKFNAQIDDSNARLYDLQAQEAKGQADYAYDRGNFDAAKLMRKVNATVGGQTAYYAANNLDPTQGSPILLAARTIGAGETDAELIGVNAKMEAAQSLARGAQFQQNAATSTAQAMASRAKASNDMLAGILGAGTAMLSAGKGGGFNFSGAPTLASAAAGNPLFINQPTDL